MDDNLLFIIIYYSIIYIIYIIGYNIYLRFQNAIKYIYY